MSVPNSFASRVGLPRSSFRSVYCSPTNRSVSANPHPRSSMWRTSSDITRRFWSCGSSFHAIHRSSCFGSRPSSRRNAMHASPLPESRGIHGSLAYWSILWIGRVSRPNSRRSTFASSTPACTPSSRIWRLKPVSRRNSRSCMSATAPTIAIAARSVFRESIAFATRYVVPDPLAASLPSPSRCGFSMSTRSWASARAARSPRASRGISRSDGT